MSALPRISRAATAAALTVAVVLAFAGPAMAKGKAPVKLDGKVNNKGVGAVKSGSADLELDNFYFEKTFLKGSAGTVTLNLENEGSVPHSFTIDDQDIDQVVQPGDSKSVTVQLTGTAPTTFYCKFHVGQGMQGALFVKAGGTASTGSKSGNKSGGNSGPGGYDYGN